MRLEWRLACLLGLMALLTGGLRANELFGPAPLDEVSVRTLPAFTVIETDGTGTLDKVWDHGFQLGARYAALAHSGLNTPTVLTFPDWVKSPVADGAQVHLLVQILLDPLPGLPRVHDHGATLQQMPSMTVACYAQTGNYSPASFLLGLQKIHERMKARNIPEVGPPRYLYYTTTSWMPSWWRVGEVQVPIAAGAQ